MIKAPKVSVLMPNYNGEKYLSESIESILNQSFPNFEFIIIDDCSTDNSWKIIREYEQKDKRIKAIQNEKNLGIAKTRNKLIAKAQGEYITWQDSDDISKKYRIERQLVILESDEQIGICGGGLQLFNKKGDTTKRLYAKNDRKLRKTIFRYSPISQGASTYRKKAIDEVGGYSEKLSTAEDLDLSFRIGEKYKFANIEEIVLCYRQHESDTFKNLRQMEIETIKMRWNYSKSEKYFMSFGDVLYNIFQYISTFIIPSKLKIALFNLLRNTK